MARLRYVKNSSGDAPAKAGGSKIRHSVQSIRAFYETEAEIAKALKIVAAFEKAQAAGLGVVSLGSKMIDPPVIEQARRLVEQARELNLLDGKDEV